MNKQIDPRLIQKLAQSPQQSMQIKEQDIIICHKCQSEFFISGVRIAKTKVDFKNEAVGLIHERPFLFCFHCKNPLPEKISDIITKKSLMSEDEIEPESSIITKPTPTIGGGSGLIGV